MGVTIEEARELVADRLLWPHIRDFLWDFAPQVHTSWLAGLPGLETLSAGSEGDGAESPRAMRLMSSPRVKRHVLDLLGVEPCFHAFPKDDWSRLLLLDGSTLESVAKWLGAIACAGSLRRVTDGATVRNLKASLPGVYPEVFGFTEYFRGLDFGRKGAEAQGSDLANGEVVVQEGVAMVSGVLSGLPESLVSRLKLKLPKGLCDVEPLRLKPEMCGKALAKLLKLKFPEAYKLCC